MLKDREGFMWFGSWDGINRFDGQKFVSYKSSPGDRSQLGNDRIDQIVEDQSGYFWILAYDKQVYQFDKKINRFLPLSTIFNPGDKKVNFNRILLASNGWVWLQSAEEGIFCIPQKILPNVRFTQYKKGLAADFRLPADEIKFFHEDNDHQIWIGTSNGLSYLHLTNGAYINSKIVPPDLAEGTSVTAFGEDKNNLYFSSADGNLISFDKKSRGFSVRKIANSHLNALIRSQKRDVIYATTSTGDVVTLDLKGQKFSKVSYHSGESLNSLYEDRNGYLWIEPEKSGAIRFDPSNQSFQYFSQANKEGLNTIGNRFRILEDNNGLVWVNMKEGGFGYYNTSKETVDNFLMTPDASNHRLPNIIYDIYYDSTGVLWITTYDREVIKIIIQQNNFKHQLLVEQGASASDNEVRGIFCDNQNRLWIGAKSGKVYVFQNEKRIRDVFENEPPEGLGLVYSILQDKRGNIWLGTKGNGLYKASPINKEQSKFHLIHFVANKNDSNSLQCNEIYALVEDNQGRIWIGSFDNGLTMVVDNGPSISFISTGNAFKNYPKDAFQKIRHLTLDGDGNLWIATTNGLLLLNVNDRHATDYDYTTYSKIPGDRESLGNNDVQFIYRDSNNRMWLATSGGGFCQAIGNKPFQSLRFRNYTRRDGLPNDYVLSCSEDQQGNLWIATENGLSKFNPETKIFRNYDSYDGLPKTSFSEASVCKQVQAGRLLFGTTKGFFSFDTKNISASPISANIAFTNLQINNEDVGPGRNEEVLKENINYVSGLTLQYNQNIISIDYTILDQRAGNQQGFAYRLIGFDTNWHEDRQFRRAAYTNLPPRHYVFEVKSTSTDLYTNAPYKRLAITILPPPWKTWWAYLLYAIIAFTLLYIVWQYALAMIRLRNKISVEQKLAALKLNFFTNISHELRTPLTLIVNPLEQVARKGEFSPEIASYIDVARKNAARMVGFINQLLDLRKVQSNKETLRISMVEIVTFVKKISEHFTEAARAKRIKLEISAKQKELFAWVDAEKLDVVIYNLLGNAVKFTPEGKQITIFIHSLPDEQSFSISIQDQGPGVPKEKLEEIFELFHAGDYSDGRAFKGTGIGLALSREFVNLHGGRIWAENNDEGGLKVTVKLKLGSQHYSEHFKKGEVSFVELPNPSPVHETPIEQQLIPASLNIPSANQTLPLVLLVEDNDELRSFIKGQLSEFYKVETARDGEEGLQKAVSLLPDLIVSDIMMPKMDGIQMLDKVKNDVNTSHIPVVLLSAKYSIESQIEGLKYGADYYITKPFNNEFLMASIDNLLRQRKKLFESIVEKKKSVELSPSPVLITSKDETFLKEVVTVVEQEMGDSNFNVESLAGTMLINQNTFYKKFKSLTGLTLVEFLRDMRLQRAKQLLDVGGNNVSEVAYEVGFNNPKYFSTCFKEKYHVSPSEYVKSKV